MSRAPLSTMATLIFSFLFWHILLNQLPVLAVDVISNVTVILSHWIQETLLRSPCLWDRRVNSLRNGWSLGMDACAAQSSMWLVVVHCSRYQCSSHWQLLWFVHSFFPLNLVHVYIFRDNGVKAIENLMTKRGRFDYVLLETTGLADPGMDYILTQSYFMFVSYFSFL